MRETPHNPFKELWRREEKDGWRIKFILLLKPSRSLVFTLMRSFCIVPGQEEKKEKEKKIIKKEKEKKKRKRERERKESPKFKDNESLGAFLVPLQLAYTKTSVLSHGRAFAPDLSEAAEFVPPEPPSAASTGAGKSAKSCNYGVWATMVG